MCWASFVGCGIGELCRLLFCIMGKEGEGSRRWEAEAPSFVITIYPLTEVLEEGMNLKSKTLLALG